MRQRRNPRQHEGDLRDPERGLRLVPGVVRQNAPVDPGGWACRNPPLVSSARRLACAHRLPQFPTTKGTTVVSAGTSGEKGHRLVLMGHSCLSGKDVDHGTVRDQHARLRCARRYRCSRRTEAAALSRLLDGFRNSTQTGPPWATRYSSPSGTGTSRPGSTTSPWTGGRIRRLAPPHHTGLGGRQRAPCRGPRRRRAPQ